MRLKSNLITYVIIIFVPVTLAHILNDLANFLADISFTICGTNETNCGGGKCIEITKQCNGEIDCPNGSDEENCDLIKCQPPRYYRCQNGSCISDSAICDNKNDCVDGDDEAKCQLKDIEVNRCSPDQFYCPNGPCISRNWVCDGSVDCPGGYDETTGCQTKNKCEGNEFMCLNHRCIFSKLVCDGSDDCGDNSDEKHCDSAPIDLTNCTVNNGKFACEDKLKCIDIRETCDNKNDCFDQSDEKGFCMHSKQNITCVNCSHDCVTTPKGPLCLCSPGYIYKENTSCEDINECEKYGICDQSCTNMPGSYHCSCGPNYELKSDGRTCKIKDGSAMLMYSATNEIKGLFLEDHHQVTMVDKILPSVGIAAAGEYIYFTVTQEKHQVIVKVKDDGQDREMIVTCGLGKPEDLAVDWITSNIYFTDKKYRHIGVCTNDGYSCTVLINEDIDKPRDVALSPHHGLMFWTDWGSKPLIGRSGMDGSNVIAFVAHDVIWPNGVTVDVPAERVYWVDAKLKKIETMKFDRTDRRTVLEEVLQPFSIAVFENKLYWSDVNGHQIQSCDKFTGKERQSLVRDPINRIYGLHVHHSLLQPTEISNPCSRLPCSDICLLSPSTRGLLDYHCACPAEKKEMNDGKCVVNGMPTTIIAGFQSRLFIIEYKYLGRNRIKEIPLETKSISALAYNNIDDTVLISDIELRTIYSYNLKNESLSSVISQGLSHVRDIHYDEFGNNLYWCDWDSLTVEAMSLTTLSRITIASGTSMEIPIDIALVPHRGFMFVAFSVYSNPPYLHIDRLSMDGALSSKIRFVDTNLPGTAIRLHFDDQMKQLFWANWNTGEIESIDIDGGDIRSYEKTTSPVSLTSAGGKLFWTNSKSSIIYEMDVHEEVYSENLNLDISFFGMDEIELTVAKKFNGSKSPCHTNNGGCSHLCLMSHEASNKMFCACPAGYSLSTDNFTCLKPKSCSLKEYQCYTGECISMYLVCNKHEDCLHGDDEFLNHCEKPHCPPEQFLCFDQKRCIDRERKCDGHYDCDDHSDEICNVNCTDENFWCDSGECIDYRFRCDGKVDCKDAHDELNCSQAICKNHDFQCNSGQCIPKEWECDREPDCVDGSDESDKCREICYSDEFRCNNEKCVDVVLTCNGNNDCGDGSDELQCKSNLDSSYEHIYKMCNPLTEFYCATTEHRCLPISVRCNGTVECINGADERNCDTNPCIIGVEFYCRKTRKCIPLEWLCDRSNDCGDNSDELTEVCINKRINHKTCHGFQCANGECISLLNVCNNISDCSDQSDERGECDISCEKFGCAQKCNRMPSGPLCACSNGYELSKDNKTCVDINECDLEICAQTCTNEIGSFKCGCYSPAFSLRTDRVSCKANGESMKYIATSNMDLVIISNNLRHKHNVNMGTQLFARIVGLDVDVSDNYYVLLENDKFYGVNAINPLKHNQLHLPQATNFAYDWITESIFFIKSRISIMVTRFNSSKNALLYNTNDEHYMWALSVDPVAGYLFWFESSMESDNSNSGIIKRADCNGADVHKIVESLSYGIRQFAIDSYSRHIYWLDRNQFVHRMAYDGSEIKLILKADENVVTFTYFENSLYWVMQGVTQFPIKKCKIHGLPPRKCEIIKFNMNSIEHLAIMQPNRQRIVPNPCTSVNCTDNCVSTSSGPVCLCNNESTNQDSCYQMPGVLFKLNAKKSGFGIFVALFMIICLIAAISVILYFHFCKPKSKILQRLYFHNPTYGIGGTSTNCVSICENRLNSKDHCYENPLCQQSNLLQHNELSVQKDGTSCLQPVQEESIDVDYNLNGPHSYKESLIKN